MNGMARARFGLFDFDPDTGELFRDGRLVHLQAQPAKVLAVLIATKGGLVTRQVLRETLWPEGTSVDFDRSLNFAVAQLRTALGDSADSPTFIRTVPKRGYQLLAPVTERPAGPSIAEAVGDASPPDRRWLLSRVAATAVAASALAGVAATWRWRAQELRIAVARFQNETGNAALDPFADTLTDSLVAGMTERTAGLYGVIGNASILRRTRRFQDLDEISSGLNARYVIIGQIQQEGPRARVLAHLIRLPEKTHVVVSRTELEEMPSGPRTAARIVDDLAKRLDLPPSATH